MLSKHGPSLFLESELGVLSVPELSPSSRVREGKACAHVALDEESCQTKGPVHSVSSSLLASSLFGPPRSLHSSRNAPRAGQYLTQMRLFPSVMSCCLHVVLHVHVMLRAFLYVVPSVLLRHPAAPSGYIHSHVGYHRLIDGLHISVGICWLHFSAIHNAGSMVSTNSSMCNGT